MMRMNRVRSSIGNNKILQFLLHHKKLSIILILGILILGIIFRPKAPEPLETVTIQKDTIQQSISASGSINSESLVTLNFVTSGKVMYLGAKKGDRVTKGQTIATLDTRTTQKNLEAALRDYAKQRNTFEQTQDDRGVHNIQNASNETLKRIMQNNQYDLEKAVLSVELQELAKQSSTLTSPIAGILIRSDVKVAGVNVSPTTQFVVADPDSLVFNVDVDESDIGKIHIGQSVKISLDAYPDEPVYATVISIDFASHTTSTGGNAYTVETELPLDSAERYRIGMNGDAEIILSEKRNVALIPLSSIVDDEYVYVQGPKTFEKRKIKLGIQNDIDAEVKSGLKVGEKVAVAPTEVEKRQNIKRTDE